MPAPQPDLFANISPPRPQVSEEIVAIYRARPRATLELVRSAETMPWDDMMTIIHEDNAFRYGKDVLPPEEGAAMWAEFDKEMDRLYAIMNEGKEMPDY